jgi:hypothetical protein
MNHLDRVNNNFSRLGKFTRPTRSPLTIPGFIGADNRRDDEYERIPGLRRVPQYDGKEYVGSIWAEENSTAAQTQQQTRGPRLTPEQIEMIRGQLKFALNPKESKNGEKCQKFLNATLEKLDVNENQRRLV